MFKDAGIAGFEYQGGTTGSHDDGTWFSHVWLVRGSLIVDITADQFDDNISPVRVSNSEPWYDVFHLDERKPSDFRQWHGNGIDQLSVFYATVKSKLLPS